MVKEVEEDEKKTARECTKELWAISSKFMGNPRWDRWCHDDPRMFIQSEMQTSNANSDLMNNRYINTVSEKVFAHLQNIFRFVSAAKIDLILIFFSNLEYIHHNTYYVIVF